MNWAMLAFSLLLLVDPAWATAPSPRVVLYVVSTPEEAHAVERVRAALHSRLLEEGFDVSAGASTSDPGMGADEAVGGALRLHVEVTGERWLLRANGAGELRDEIDARGEFDVVVLELVHKAVAVLQGVGRAPEGEFETSPDANPAPENPAAEPTLETRAPIPSEESLTLVAEPALETATSTSEIAEPWGYVLGVRAGVLVRGEHFDPMLSAQLFTTGGAFGLRAQVDAVASDVKGRLDVWEAGALAGPQLGFPTSKDARWIVGALLGTRVHRFVYDAEDRGFRWTWLAAAPVEWRFETDRFSYGLGASLGVSGKPPTHVVLGTPTWQRSTLSWDVGCSMGIKL